MAIRHYTYTSPIPQSFDIRDILVPKRFIYDCAAQGAGLDLVVQTTIADTDNHALMHFISELFLGSKTVPNKYYHENGELMEVKFGRSRFEIIKKGKLIRHHFIETYEMPDGEIHVLLVDVDFV